MQHGCAVDVATRDGDQPLHLASAWGYVVCQSLLLGKGAEVGRVPGLLKHEVGRVLDLLRREVKVSLVPEGSVRCTRDRLCQVHQGQALSGAPWTGAPQKCGLLL